MAQVQRHLQKVSAGERGAKAMCDGWSGGGGEGAVQRGEGGGGGGGEPELLTSKYLGTLACVSADNEN